MALVSCVMGNVHEDWTVDWNVVGDFSATPQTYDTKREAMTQEDSMPVRFRCTNPKRPGVIFEVDGVLTTTSWTGAGKYWRLPWKLTTVTRIALAADGATTHDLFKELGLGSLHKAIGDHFRDLALLDKRLFGHADALPKPGPKGHPPDHYAIWAQRIIKARREHGRGYMKQLLASNPGETRSNVLRKLDVAKDLGLAEEIEKPAPGRIGRDQMTARGNALLKEAGQQ